MERGGGGRLSSPTHLWSSRLLRHGGEEGTRGIGSREREIEIDGEEDERERERSRIMNNLRDLFYISIPININYRERERGKYNILFSYFFNPIYTFNVFISWWIFNLYFIFYIIDE